jgi:hypothetical protein
LQAGVGLNPREDFHDPFHNGCRNLMNFAWILLAGIGLMAGSLAAVNAWERRRARANSDWQTRRSGFGKLKSLFSCCVGNLFQPRCCASGY